MSALPAYVRQSAALGGQRVTSANSPDPDSGRRQELLSPGEGRGDEDEDRNNPWPPHPHGANRV